MTKSALGKGFEGLIPVGFDVVDIASPGEQVKSLRLDQIVTNPDQPRKMFDQSALEELSQSIKTYGIIQPLVVTPVGEHYRIVAGERRFRAAQIAGIKKVPAIIRDHKELEELEIALVENVQRVDLSPLEQAVSIVRLRDQFSLSVKEIADKLGKAETTISNIVRLLQLPKEAVVALQNGSISEGHARCLLSLKTDQSSQLKLLQNIVDNKLSVREAEAWVITWKSQNEQKNDSVSTSVKTALNLLNKQGYIAKVQSKKKGGVLHIEYKNETDLEKLLNRF